MKKTEDLTNAELMEELERRFRNMGYFSILDVQKTEYFFRHLDDITTEDLEAVVQSKGKGK